jgi:hypothetical protein
MGDTKYLLEEDCEYKYIPEMEKDLNHADKLRNISKDFIDRVLLSGEVSHTDYFLLRAISFFRFATAEMVAEYIRHFKNYYGTSAISKLLIPHVLPKTVNEVVHEWGDFDKDEDMIRYRLNRLAKKYLLLSYSVSYPYQDLNKLKVIYCINYTSYNIVRSFFGNYINFSDSEIGYEKYYGVTPLARMFEELHASRVAVLAFANHNKKVLLLRDKEILFGAARKTICPVMIAKIEYEERLFKIIIDPLHFTHDERVLTEEEHRENIIARLEDYKDLIRHFRYMNRKHENRKKQEHIRFIFAVENLEGMKKIARLMNESKELFADKVFFTTDLALKNSEHLFEAVLMAKLTKSKVEDDFHLGLIRPSEEYLLATNNEWMLE